MCFCAASIPAGAPSMRFLMKPFYHEEPADQEGHEGQGKPIEVFFDHRPDRIALPAHQTGHHDPRKTDPGHTGWNRANLVRQRRRPTGKHNPATISRSCLPIASLYRLSRISTTPPTTCDLPANKATLLCAPRLALEYFRVHPL